MTTRATPLDRIDPAEAWAPWAPTAGDPWDRRWAGHLYRRAAFGASWPDLQAALDAGPAVTINRLLAGDEGHDEFDRLMDELGPGSTPSQPQEGNGGGPPGLVAPPDGPHRPPAPRADDPVLAQPLRHQHPQGPPAGPDGAAERPDPPARPRQVRALPAGDEPRPGHADLARLQQQHPRPAERELRPRGDGAVRPRASATTPRPTSARRPGRSPAGTPTGDGSRSTARSTTAGRRPCSAGPATGTAATSSGSSWSSRPRPGSSSRKLYRYFISEGEAPPDRLLEPLAERFRASGYDIADLVGTMLRSRLFFSDHAYRQRVKSPVEYVVGMLRGLEARYEPPVEYYGPQAQTRLLDGLGQALFAPPNVKGWAGGEAWLNSATLLARHNLAWKVVQATPGPLGVASSPPALVRQVRPPPRPRGAGRLPARAPAPAGRGRGRGRGPAAARRVPGTGPAPARRPPTAASARRPTPSC